MPALLGLGGQKDVPVTIDHFEEIIGHMKSSDSSEDDLPESGLVSTRNHPYREILRIREIRITVKSPRLIFPAEFLEVQFLDAAKTWDSLKLGTDRAPAELLRTLRRVRRTHADWQCQSNLDWHCRSINLPGTFRTGGVARHSHVTKTVLDSTT